MESRSLFQSFSKAKLNQLCDLDLRLQSSHHFLYHKTLVKKPGKKRSLVNFWCSRPSFRRLAVLGLSQFILYKSRCELSLFFNIFSYLNLICAHSLRKRNLQEQVKKTFCYQKLFWPFPVWINCSTLRYLINEYTRLTIQCFALSFDKS